MPVRQVVAFLHQLALEVEQVRQLVRQQAEAVHHKHAGAGFFIAQTFGLHLRDNLLGDAAACRTCAEEYHFLLAHGAARRTAGGNQGTQRNGGGTLNIIIKAANFIAVAFEDRHRIFLCEVFELQYHVRPATLHCLNEFVDEVIVLFAGDAWMTPAHIQRVIQQLLIVGADVQHDWQGIRRTDTATGGVQRELTNGNAHAADALVAQAENALAVGNDDHFDILLGGVLQHIFDVAAVRIGDKHATGTTIDFGEVFTGRADGWGVNNRHHLFKMVVQQAVEEGFVGVLDIAQINVFVVIVFEVLELLPGTLGLLFNGFDRFRQQAAQVKFISLFYRESASLIQQREFQQNRAGIRNIQRSFTFVFEFHAINTHSDRDVVGQS